MAHDAILTARQSYIDDGVARALALGNRGPLRFSGDGRLAPEILEAFDRTGFYVFQGVVDEDELQVLRAETAAVLERGPTHPGSGVDKAGRPVIDAEFGGHSFIMARPLSDPNGGTDKAQGRHPVKMSEPQAADDAPEYVVELIFNAMRLMESYVHVYGHPGILGIAESVLGPDFVPFNEAIFVKEPGVGASVAWHQDGTTHWEGPGAHSLAHGYNNQLQLYEPSPANCLWVLPGSHRQGRADIRALMESAEDDRLPGAVPILCGAGDVSICNRQAVHGSFANINTDRRWSLTFGFLPRSSVEGVTTRQLSGHEDTYDTARIRERSRMVPIAVNARRAWRPHEAPFVYQPFAGETDGVAWDQAARDYVKTCPKLNLHI